jgi:hypothetical protein
VSAPQARERKPARGPASTLQLPGNGSGVCLSPRARAAGRLIVLPQPPPPALRATGSVPMRPSLRRRGHFRGAQRAPPGLACGPLPPSIRRGSRPPSPGPPTLSGGLSPTPCNSPISPDTADPLNFHSARGSRSFSAAPALPRWTRGWGAGLRRGRLTEEGTVDGCARRPFPSDRVASCTPGPKRPAG